MIKTENVNIFFIFFYFSKKRDYKRLLQDLGKMRLKSKKLIMSTQFSEHQPTISPEKNKLGTLYLRVTD
jgi:hypothetical protein